MIIIKLREAMSAYHERTGERITYEKLAERTGLSRATLESIASRADYNTSLETIDKICKALACTPHDLLSYTEDDGEA